MQASPRAGPCTSVPHAEAALPPCRATGRPCRRRRVSVGGGLLALGAGGVAGRSGRLAATHCMRQQHRASWGHAVEDLLRSSRKCGREGRVVPKQDPENPAEPPGFEADRLLLRWRRVSAASSVTESRTLRCHCFHTESIHPAPHLNPAGARMEGRMLSSLLRSPATLAELDALYAGEAAWSSSRLPPGAAGLEGAAGGD